MGYYSTFTVIDTDITGIVDVLNDNSGVYEGWYVDSYNGVTMGAVKWYDWLTDLKTLATLYPSSYLVIERIGESSLDISRVVVKNGRATEITPELVWPEVL